MGLIFIGTLGGVTALLLALWSLRPRPRGAAAGGRRAGELGPPDPLRAVDAFLRRRYPVDPSRLAGVLAGAAVGGGVAGRIVLGPGWCWATALAAGIAGPAAWLRRAGERRRADLALEMERTTAALSAAMGAGLVPYEALLEVGGTAGGILGPEFLQTVDDAQRVGLSEALCLLRDRLPTPEVRLLVAGIRLNQGTGAELASSLAGLHRTLRERREARAAVRSATAAGRWQANVLVLVPPILLAFMRRAYPAFEAPLLTNPHGRVLLGLAAFWLMVGYFVVLRMSVPGDAAQ